MEIINITFIITVIIVNIKINYFNLKKQNNITIKWSTIYHGLVCFVSSCNVF